MAVFFNCSHSLHNRYNTWFILKRSNTNNTSLWMCAAERGKKVILGPFLGVNRSLFLCFHSPNKVCKPLGGGYLIFHTVNSLTASLSYRNSIQFCERSMLRFTCKCRCLVSKGDLRKVNFPWISFAYQISGLVLPLPYPPRSVEHGLMEG